MATLDNIVVDGSSTALVVIDIVNDMFAEGGTYHQRQWDRKPMLTMLESSLLPFIQRSKGKVPIVFVNSEYAPDEFKDDPYPIENFCIKGTSGVGFYRLDKTEADTVFTKNHWSAFFLYDFEKKAYDYSRLTELEVGLQEKGIRNLIITGVTGTHCIPINIEHALRLRYNVILPRDCVDSRGERIGHHIEYIRKYEKHPDVKVINSSQIIYPS